MDVYVELGHELDAAGWQSLHAKGLVPNELPFGLESVAAAGAALHFRPDRRRGNVTSRAMGVVNRRGAGLQWVESVVHSEHSRRRKCDVVLGWDEWTGIPAAWRSSLLPHEPPVLSGIMNLTDWPGLTSLNRGLLRGGMLRCAKLFQHSSAQAELLVHEWRIPADRIALIPFGVDAEFFKPVPTPKQQSLIVSVGDDAHRDYRGLFAIFEEVRRHVTSAQLLVATTTDLPDAPAEGVTIVAKKLGEKRPAVYSGAAVVAVNARPQVHGSGLSVVVEAMACGRPWVATASAGFRDHFSDGDGGILVPPGDRAAFVDALVDLLRNPEEADLLGKRGRELVETRLNTQVQGAAIAQVLEGVAS